MHYQIFVPGESKGAAETLKSVGLESFFVGSESTYLDPEDSPTKTSGSLFFWHENESKPRAGFVPDEQTWIPVVADGEKLAERYWIGFWNNHPVESPKLMRSDAQLGSFVKLGNGNLWSIPEVEKLSRDFVLQDDGHWAMVSQLRFNNYVTAYHEIVNSIDTSGPFSLPFEMLFNIASEGLAINYRVTPEVISHLRLFNTENLRECFQAIAGLGE